MKKKAVFSMILLPFLLTGCDVAALIKPETHEPEKPKFEEYSQRINDSQSYYDLLDDAVSPYIGNFIYSATEGNMVEYSSTEVEYYQNESLFYSLYELCQDENTQYDSTNDRMLDDSSWNEYMYVYSLERVVDNTNIEKYNMYLTYDVDKGKELRADLGQKTYQYRNSGRTSVEYLASSTFGIMAEYYDSSTLLGFIQEFLDDKEGLEPELYKDNDGKMFTVVLKDTISTERYDANKLKYKLDYTVDFILQMNFEDDFYDYKFYCNRQYTYEFAKECSVSYYDAGEYGDVDHTFYEGEKLTINKLRIKDSHLDCKDVSIEKLDISKYREMN